MNNKLDLIMYNLNLNTDTKYSSVLYYNCLYNINNIYYYKSILKGHYQYYKINNNFDGLSFIKFKYNESFRYCISDIYYNIIYSNKKVSDSYIKCVINIEHVNTMNELSYSKKEMYFDVDFKKEYSDKTLFKIVSKKFDEYIKENSV